MAQRRRDGYVVYIPQQKSGSIGGAEIFGALVALVVFVCGIGWALQSTGLVSLSSFASTTTSGSTSHSGKGGGNNSGGGGTADGAKILAQARRHDGESYVYGGGHPLSSYHNGGGLDCSSLVNVAVRDATGVKQDLLAAGFKDSSHWNPIKKTDVRPGDIMYILQANHPGRGDDHVVIVVKNNGGSRNPTIFEAYTSKVAQRDEIRVSSARGFGEYDGALRFHR